jgi:hypothetical protein
VKNILYVVFFLPIVYYVETSVSDPDALSPDPDLVF